MHRDIFISYSTKDMDIAVKARDYLENNNLSCWMAPRDIKTSDNYAQEIMNALLSAKVIVLIYSKYSQASHYVLEEIDNAFSRDKTILPFKIDDAIPEGKMEFYLRQNQWLDASSSPESFFDELVKNADRLCQGFNPKNVKKQTKEIKINEHVEKKRIPLNKIFLVALVLLVALIAFMLVEGVNDNSGGESIEIDYVGLDDDSLKGYSWKYSYFVFGSVSGESTNPDDIVRIEYMDETGNAVTVNDTRLGDIRGNLLSSAYLDDDNVDKISAKLLDGDGNVLFSTESDNIIKQ